MAPLASPTRARVLSKDDAPQITRALLWRSAVLIFALSRTTTSQRLMCLITFPFLQGGYSPVLRGGGVGGGIRPVLACHSPTYPLSPYIVYMPRTTSCLYRTLMETSNRWTREQVAVQGRGAGRRFPCNGAYVTYVSGAEESAAAAAATPTAPPRPRAQKNWGSATRRVAVSGGPRPAGNGVRVMTEAQAPKYGELARYLCSTVGDSGWSSSMSNELAARDRLAQAQARKGRE
jgi:hypothetical protein